MSKNKKRIKITGKFTCNDCGRTLPKALEVSPMDGTCLRCVRNRFESLMDDDRDELAGITFETFRKNENGEVDVFDIDEWEQFLGVPEDSDPRELEDMEAAAEIAEDMRNSSALSLEENLLQRNGKNGKNLPSSPSTEDADLKEFTEQSEHQRTSKLGKTFTAGKGAKPKKPLKPKKTKQKEKTKQSLKTDELSSDEREKELETRGLSVVPTSDGSDSLNEKIKRLGRGEGREVKLTKSELKQILDSGKFALISAGRNPANTADMNLTDEQVEERYGDLKSDLVDGGYAYTEVEGHYGGVERSFLVMVHEAEEADVYDLGEKYNQDSIIHANKGKQKMIYTTGDHSGSYIFGTGWEEKPEATDYYTEVETTDEGSFRFSLNFNFDKMFKGYRGDDETEIEEFDGQEKHIRTSKTGKKFVAGRGTKKVKYPGKRIKIVRGRTYVEIGGGAHIGGTTAKGIMIRGEWYPRKQIISEGAGKYTTYYLADWLYEKLEAERPKKEIARLKLMIEEEKQKIEEEREKIRNPDPYSSKTKEQKEETIKYLEKSIKQLEERIESWKQR